MFLVIFSARDRREHSATIKYINFDMYGYIRIVLIIPSDLLYIDSESNSTVSGIEDDYFT